MAMTGAETAAYWNSTPLTNHTRATRSPDVIMNAKQEGPTGNDKSILLCNLMALNTETRLPLSWKLLMVVRKHILQHDQ